jgi:hypothetical protein
MEPVWPVEFGKYRVDGGKAHQIECLLLVKISAYANDTAVHLGSLADIKIFHLLLQQYVLATGGVINFYKSEGVLCRR